MKHILLAIGLLLVAASPAASATRPTAAQCTQLRTALATYGQAMVMWGARLRGYDDNTIRAVRRICKV